MEEYDQCQRIKNRLEILVKKLKPNTVLEKPWQHILMDFISKLLILRDYNSILVVCDKFSKILYFISTLGKITIERERLVRLFRNNV